MGRYVLKIETGSETDTAVPDTEKIDKRKHSRVQICVPISCVSIDEEAMPLDQNMGIIRDVSQTGVGIEAHNDVRSDRLILTFVDLDKRIAEVEGKVVFSKKAASGTYKIGLSLQGDQSEILGFVKKLIRFHHYTKKTK
jgi:PilZ domain